MVLAILGAALGAECAGLSMALGAFVLGMMLSGSAFQQRIEAIVGRATATYEVDLRQPFMPRTCAHQRVGPAQEQRSDRHRYPDPQHGKVEFVAIDDARQVCSPEEHESELPACDSIAAMRSAPPWPSRYHRASP